MTGAPYILTTRPAEDAGRDAAFLNARGASCLSAPMLEIRSVNAAIPDLAGMEAVVLTSRHAAAQVELSAFHGLPCFCVGKTTAEAATKAGFHQVITGPGDGAGLAETLRQHPYRQLCWPSAQDTGFNIARAVAEDGIHIERVVVYEAAPVADFDAKVLARITAGEVKVVLAHSGRAGEHFTRLMAQHGLEHLIPGMAMIAISPRAAGLCGTDWHTIEIVETPRRSAMLEAAITALKEAAWQA